MKNLLQENEGMGESNKGEILQMLQI